MSRRRGVRAVRDQPGRRGGGYGNVDGCHIECEDRREVAGHGPRGRRAAALARGDHPGRDTGWERVGHDDPGRVVGAVVDDRHLVAERASGGNRVRGSRFVNRKVGGRQADLGKHGRMRTKRDHGPLRRRATKWGYGPLRGRTALSPHRRARRAGRARDRDQKCKDENAERTDGETDGVHGPQTPLEVGREFSPRFTTFGHVVQGDPRNSCR